MLPEMNAVEARIVGSLIEKSIFTPDQYPLTLNALVNACNQKSSRDPVTNLKPGELRQALRQLEAKHLVRADENFRSSVEKFSQRFCNTRYSTIQFDEAELAVVCLLLLRGPQTPGELRARSGRLHSFADNEAVVAALDRLAGREGGPMVVRLPRTPGRKDSEYMHLFSGPVAVEPPAARERPVRDRAAGETTSLEALEARVGALEAEVERLKEELGRAG